MLRILSIVVFLDGYEADLFKVGMMIDTTELDPMTFVLSALTFIQGQRNVRK